MASILFFRIGSKWDVTELGIIINTIITLFCFRKLFERVINIKFSARKMKFLFKKYLDFEKSHGNNTTVAAVKQKALQYVESQGYVDDK
jgi:hypothetical protein